jgi:hypothetical protein
MSRSSSRSTVRRCPASASIWPPASTSAIARGASLECRPKEARLLEAAEHQDRRPATRTVPPDDLQAARFAAQPYIAHDDIGSGALDQRDRSADIGRPADELDLAVTAGGVCNRDRDCRMVVDDGEADHRSAMVRALIDRA